MRTARSFPLAWLFTLISLVMVTVGMLVGLSAHPHWNSQTDGLPTSPKTNSLDPSQITTELRGVWLTNVDSPILFSSQILQAGLARLHQLNFNTIYPTVWNWGYTLYPSPVAASVIGHDRDPDPRLQHRDVLAELVEQGDQQHLRVIPWFEFGFMAPADSELAHRHPDWLTQRSDGTQQWQEGIHTRVWLNPFHPEVQAFLADLVLEIVQHYPIDGIQFDDHIGLPKEFGYDPYTITRYRQTHHNGNPPTDPSDSEWVRWRADQITEFMHQLATTIKQHRSDCLISLSPNPYRFAYVEHLQDWIEWQQQGWIDELILQVYRDQLPAFVQVLQDPQLQQLKLRLPLSIGILAGLKGRSHPMAQIQAQVEQVRRHQYAGVSFFFYESLWQWAREPIQYREAGLQQLFPTPAQPAVLTSHGLPNR